MYGCACARAAGAQLLALLGRELGLAALREDEQRLVPQHGQRAAAARRERREVIGEKAADEARAERSFFVRSTRTKIELAPVYGICASLSSATARVLRRRSSLGDDRADDDGLAQRAVGARERSRIALIHGRGLKSAFLSAAYRW